MYWGGLLPQFIVSLHYFGIMVRKQCVAFTMRSFALSIVSFFLYNLLMISFIARLFIKNYKNYSESKVRTAYGILCSAVGIFFNILLSAFKFIAGYVSSSVALTADALNNLSDAASSLCTILGFKLGAMKPDKDHPFGHGRMEYVAGLAVSGIIVFMGIELFISSVKAIIHPEKTECTSLSVIIMIVAVAVKFYMYAYNHSTAKKISSPALEATAKDSFGDVISTTVALAALIAGQWTSLPVDGFGGIVVSFFILKSGREALKETLDPLLGLPPEKEFVEAIEKEVMSHPEICGIHDLIVHDYGPGRKIISLHAEVPGDKNVFALHDAIDIVEVTLSRKFNCWTTIHMDPVDTKNERLAELKSELVQVAKNIDSRITVHDVRIVPGTTHSNLIFDVVRPLDCSLTARELKKEINRTVHNNHKDIYCVITVDNPLV